MQKKNQTGYDFIAMEKKWLKHWYENGVIDSYLHKNDTSEETFSFQDGPITANNPMGVHHAWGRTYKDLYQKFHNLLGKRQRFQNGFDCQGLWVEVEVEKELKLRSKKDIENLIPGDPKASVAQFVALCKKRVHTFSNIQTEQSKRLGYFMDWDHSYFTMSDENNYMIWKFLKTCHEHGWIYKGNESVPWCPRCETAISQHEMLTEDYKELTHDAIYLQLPLIKKDNEYLLIWTTTPWTIPANIAVAVDENLDYALVEIQNGKRLWVAADTVSRVFGEESTKIVKKIPGKELVGLKYQGPFDSLPAVEKVIADSAFHTVIATDPFILPISTQEGTGLVHTAVSAGVEDFKLGKLRALPMIPVIADDASYLPDMGALAGKNAKKHPELIFEYLKEREKTGEHWIYSIHPYKHRYPACWRCKTELVWKVADEWYIAMDRPSAKTPTDKNATLRNRMIAVAKQITWMPSFGLDRELDWLKNMHDWLISKKNRFWGLSLPIYECVDCASFEVIGSKNELKERAVSGFEQFEGHSPHKPYIDEVQIACSGCAKPLTRIEDVGNPWLDAGIVPFSTITEHNTGEPLYTKDYAQWKRWFPVDFITESFPGQFKNWFYALIAEATVLENTAPFKRVLGFGTLLAEDGRPMHKSWGNSIEFNEGADEIGVDVMRFMYAQANPSENMLFGPKRANEVRRLFYLPLWNVFQYYQNYAALDRISPDPKKLVEPRHVLDRWILSRLYSFLEQARMGYEAFDVRLVAQEAETFVNQLSTWYIRRSRNRVFIHSDDTEDKVAFYQTLHIVLRNVCIVLSPVMPFITEEIYTSLTGQRSVHLTSWPQLPKTYQSSQSNSYMSVVRDIVEAGHRTRKELQIKIRQPLASATVFYPKRNPFSDKASEDYIRLLCDEFNVKKLIIKPTDEDQISVSYETKLTDELQKEGEVRELIRTIQALRKTEGLRIDEKISLRIPHGFENSENEIRKSVLVDQIQYGDTLSIIAP